MALARARKRCLGQVAKRNNCCARITAEQKLRGAHASERESNYSGAPIKLRALFAFRIVVVAVRPRAVH